jgi:DNA end-binding protein Ku
LTLTMMFYPDEIRSIDAIPNLSHETKIDQKGMVLAQMLIEHMSQPFTTSEYRDENRDQLITFIHRKIAGEEIVIQPQSNNTVVIDLMTALQASLDAIKAANEPKKPKRKKSAKVNQTVLTDEIETA